MLSTINRIAQNVDLEQVGSGVAVNPHLSDTEQRTGHTAHIDTRVRTADECES